MRCAAFAVLVAVAVPVTSAQGDAKGAPASRFQVIGAPTIVAEQAEPAFVPKSPEGGGRSGYLVQLEEPPLASYRGGRAGLPATSPVTTGAPKLDLGSSTSRAYLQFLGQRRREALTRMQQAIGRALATRFEYQVAFHGAALDLTPE